MAEIDLEQRLILIQDDINAHEISAASSGLIKLLLNDDKKESEKKNFKRKPIKLYINSLGGSIYDMWSLIDIISNSKTPIYTYCTGYAMSAAFQIFLAGHKRYATKHATFMYHQMSGCNWGNYQDMVDDMEENEYIQSEIEKYVFNRTKITKKQLNDVRKSKKDWYIHTDEALELGIVDEAI